MRITLVNPPHTAIGSRIPGEHLPPHGLLCIGGPLIDAGHQVVLIDADREALADDEVVRRICGTRPDVVMFGHSGSTSAHPTIARLAQRVRGVLPEVTIVVGGVYPSYHWAEVLDGQPAIDVAVIGEGEHTTLEVVRALDRGGLPQVAGIALRDDDGAPYRTGRAEVIHDLDVYRVGWELIDHADYSYYGGMRAVVVQLSRGCPYPCTYCGQRGFWTQYRHRDPVRLAAEIARLHREQGVQLFNLADELPTGSRKVWRAFLEALIAEDVDVTLIGSTRADHIVRDADILHLYRRAGVARFLLGMEHTDASTLERVRKGGDTTTDREAIRLLRQHDILSMATWVVGFEEERPRDLLHGLKQILAYDPDQIQVLYVTPHRWTPFFEEARDRQVVQLDQRRWDYKHQVLATRYLKPWQLLALVKALEVAAQARPKAIWRVLAHADPIARHGMRWYTRMGRRVWLHELRRFLLEPRVTDGPTLEAHWGEPTGSQLSMARRRRAS